MGRLENKSAVILGASKRDNMGQVIARRFMSEGARVVAAGRDRVELDRFAESSGATAIPCDITKKEDIEALAATAKRTLGSIDIAVNCSGLSARRKLASPMMLRTSRPHWAMIRSTTG